MKKILSLILSVVFIFKLTVSETMALGKNEQLYDESGSKTIFVSSDRLNAYLNELEKEVLQCRQEYNNWYSGKKGFFARAGIMFMSTLATVGAGVLLKGYNYFSRRPKEPQNDQQEGTKVDTSLSFAQICALILVFACSSFAELKLLLKFSPSNKEIVCDRLLLRNEGIYRTIANPISDEMKEFFKIEREREGFQADIWTYGAIIECKEGDTGICGPIYSQKRVYDPKSEYYDPLFAQTCVSNLIEDK